MSRRAGTQSWANERYTIRDASWSVGSRRNSNIEDRRGKPTRAAADLAPVKSGLARPFRPRCGKPQADCLAGVCASRSHAKWQFLDPGDIDAALQTASAIADDTLQKRAQGYVVPDAFTHGSAEQRKRWFAAGLKVGTLESCDTFGAAPLTGAEAQLLQRRASARGSGYALRSG